jgi:hypothetical protein
MGLIVIAIVIRFEYKGTSKSIKRVDLHKITQNPYKSASSVFWIHDSRFEIPDSKFKDYVRSLGAHVETWHAASLLVLYKIISVNLFNLRHLCSGFKIPDSKFQIQNSKIASDHWEDLCKLRN